MNSNRQSFYLYYIFFSLTLIIGIIGRSLLNWYEDTFNVSIAEIIFTIQGPLAGADSHFLRSALLRCLPSLISFLLLLSVIVALFRYYGTITDSPLNIRKRPIAVILCFFTLFSSLNAFITLSEADEVLQVSSFLASKLDKTTIYDDYYVKPDINAITAEKPRNLIYIIMESMETTYASEETGGAQRVNNYIPRLTELADEHISFSNTEKLGGFRSLTGSTWTMGSIFSTESGIPFAFPIDGNHMGSLDKFASGTITLGDILHGKGYYQEFLCGSDGEFAGRKMFFEQHGYDRVYDLYSAIDDGYVKKANKWWGLEDRKLYRIAKDELSRLSESDEPFNLTMLTVDTHHVDGWVCKFCKDQYPDQLANVVRCADNQVYNFIDWCKKQPWYENTTIIIQGDHPRMDNSLVDGLDPLDRTIYNCFINAPYDKAAIKTKQREFTAFDMFPSILASAGFSIPGDRLGLGTNIFSPRKTLSEQMGYEKLDRELQKGSDYYKRFF